MFSNTDVLLDSAIDSQQRKVALLLLPKTQYLYLQDMKCGFSHVPQHKEFKSEILVSQSLKSAYNMRPQDKAGSIFHYPAEAVLYTYFQTEKSQWSKRKGQMHKHTNKRDPDSSILSRKFLRGSSLEFLCLLLILFIVFFLYLKLYM